MVFVLLVKILLDHLMHDISLPRVFNEVGMKIEDIIGCT